MPNSVFHGVPLKLLLRIELLNRLPAWLSKKGTVLGCTSSDGYLVSVLEGDIPE